MKKEMKEMFKVYKAIFKGIVFLGSIIGFFIAWFYYGDLLGVVGCGILMILVCLDNIKK